MFHKDSLPQSQKLKERNLLHKRIADLAELQMIYEIGEVLGKGSFGTVVKANHKASNVDWAIKIINKSQAGASRIVLVEREIHILKLVNHPNIILLDRVFESPKTMYLVFELCTGSLAKTLKAKKRFDETETLTVIRSLASALSYLHKNDIVHRDLKLENILIAANPENLNDNLHIKVTDFGLSAIRRGGKGYESMLHDCCGTLTYMAPEMISTKSYSQQCDVWSMGVIMYILLVGKFPFYSTNDQQLYSLVRTQELDLTDLSCSAAARHVLSKMLHKNPAFRMTAAEVENHPWILGADSRLHCHSSNVLDMMRMWRTEMMQSSEGNRASIAVNGQSTKDYPETVSIGVIPTTAGQPGATAVAEQSMTSKRQSHNNGEISTLTESPYPKHRFWENARLSAVMTAAESSPSETKAEKPLESTVTGKLHTSVDTATTDTRHGSVHDPTQKANETARVSGAKLTIEKRHVNPEHHRFQSSRLPNFSHIPAKVDSNLTTLRKEAQAQRKRGYINNSKL